MFARAHRVSKILLISTVTAGFALVACGGKGSSGTEPPPSVAQGAGCAPIAAEQLVLLADDKKLQDSDNIVAVANAAKATPALLTAVDKVAAALDQPKLLALNKSVEIDRKTPQVAAQDFAAANGLTAPASGGSGPVVIGAANFPESTTLAELYKIVLNAAGFQATVQQSTSREVYGPALEKGDLTIFPEYAATMTEFLNKEVNGANAAHMASGDINATMTALKELAAKRGLTAGTPSTASDQNAFAVTKALADKYSLKTLSDFASKCSGAATVLGGPPECPQRPFCQPGLETTYNLKVGKFSSLDAGGPQTKNALTTGSISIGLVFSSDGALAS